MTYCHSYCAQRIAADDGSLSALAHAQTPLKKDMSHRSAHTHTHTQLFSSNLKPKQNKPIILQYYFPVWYKELFEMSKDQDAHWGVDASYPVWGQWLTVIGFDSQAPSQESRAPEQPAFAAVAAVAARTPPGAAESGWRHPRCCLTDTKKKKPAEKH